MAYRQTHSKLPADVMLKLVEKQGALLLQTVGLAYPESDTEIWDMTVCLLAMMVVQTSLVKAGTVTEFLTAIDVQLKMIRGLSDDALAMNGWTRH